MTRKAPSHPVIPIRPIATAIGGAGDPDDGAQLASTYQKQLDICPRAVKGWLFHADLPN